MSYAAYLRIYEPVAVFREPERSRWAAYAASPARPGRRAALAAEQAEALYRVIVAARIVVPDQESQHANVRRAEGARSRNTRRRTEYRAERADSSGTLFPNPV